MIRAGHNHWWSVWVTALALLLTLGLVAIAPAPAWAGGDDDDDDGGGGGSGGGGQTVKITINIPALVVDNLCNTDVVNLSGDMHITTTTTPHSNGGYTVRSSAVAPNLRGNRIAPPPAIRYRGDDREQTYQFYAPPPQPSTHRYAHYTKLVPQGRAPTMYLVVVIRGTILEDGTPVPVAERAYLVCRPPSR